MRHQLRTPVNHVVGFSEMLQEEAADRSWDALLPDLERIRQAGRGLAEYIGSTIELARVEAGTLDAEAISYDLRTPLDSIVGCSQLLQEVAEERGWHEALPDLGKIESAARHLTTLITAVLELTKLCVPLPAQWGKLGEGTPSPDSRSGSILLADDDNLDAEMLSRRLEQAGYRVTRVACGPDTLTALERSPFDLLLLDVLMPGQDGLETLRWIKALAGHADLPVLMISAVEEIPIVVRCIELGADDYLVKPVDAVLLRAKIDASLERRRLLGAESRLLSQLGALTAATAALESGAFDPQSLAELVAREDALGRLARVFTRMAQRRQGATLTPSQEALT